MKAKRKEVKKGSKKKPTAQTKLSGFMSEKDGDEWTAPKEIEVPFTSFTIRREPKPIVSWQASLTQDKTIDASESSVAHELAAQAMISLRRFSPRGIESRALSCPYMQTDNRGAYVLFDDVIRLLIDRS